jgi:hypothetical protein
LKPSDLKGCEDFGKTLGVTYTPLEEEKEKIEKIRKEKEKAKIMGLKDIKA